MKSILVGPKEKKEEKSQYPYLGFWKRDGLVVLFSAPNTGTVVHAVSSPWPVGHTAGDWGEGHSFVPLKGKITLSN